MLIESDRTANDYIFIQFSRWMNTVSSGWKKKHLLHHLGVFVKKKVLGPVHVHRHWHKIVPFCTSSELQKEQIWVRIDKRREGGGVPPISPFCCLFSVEFLGKRPCWCQ